MSTVPIESVAILLRPEDDVAIARDAIVPGTDVEGFRVSDQVPPGHKLAVHFVKAGHAVRKYGQTIGFATRDIAPGDWVHSHNLDVGPLELAFEFGTAIDSWNPEAGEPRTFQGFSRHDGRVGTRNWLAIVSSVNCSADTCHRVSALLNEEAADYPNVDGVFAVTHQTGCGMAIEGAEYKLLQRTLAGMADHPNVGGTLMIGLGCEVNQPHTIVRESQLHQAGPPILSIQRSGGVRKTIHEAIEIGRKLLKRANEAERSTQPINGLLVGTNCGGSDGNSGITANPALGVAGDLMVSHNGSWVLAETSETYGAEHLLTKRAVSREVGEKLLSLMRWWERYASMHGVSINNNPTPGNKEGGITTIYEKSLGAVMKSGSSPLVEVYDYGQRVDKPGFSFMDTPGMDPVSVTGLVAGGCNLVAFTTGRGSCLGFKPSPVLKIASTTKLYERMPEDMDIDAGVILSGVPVEDVGRMIFEKLIAVASGEKTKSEAQGLGDCEFAPWALGPVL